MSEHNLCASCNHEVISAEDLNEDGDCPWCANLLFTPNCKICWHPCYYEKGSKAVCDICKFPTDEWWKKECNRRDVLQRRKCKI